MVDTKGRWVAESDGSEDDQDDQDDPANRGPRERFDDVRLSVLCVSADGWELMQSFHRARMTRKTSRKTKRRKKTISLRLHHLRHSYRVDDP
jgi:hypothetical protein